MDDLHKVLSALFATYALSVVGGVSILVAGWFGANWLGRLVRQAMRRLPRVDDTLGSFVASIVRYGALALVGVAVLNQFGVQTASVIAVLGAAGLAIGLALQGTLSHLAAGVMLLLFRPFAVGDEVQLGDHKGAVRELNMFTTEIDTPDNVRVILPNGKVWGEVIQNLTRNPSRRVGVDLNVPWAQDLPAIKEAVLAAARATPGIAASPEPNLKVKGLDGGGATLRLEAWIDGAGGEAVEALGWSVCRAIDAARGAS